jgi:hypothetical protein
MKFISFITFVILLTLNAFSQPDTAAYYASSRMDYYTTEEVGEILVYTPERLKGTKITIDLVFEYQNLNKGYPAFSGGISTIPFPMKLLREGQNEITVSFYENEKWVDSRKVWITVRPHRENAVKIDLATGGIFVSGLPVVPFGFTSSFPVDYNAVNTEVAKGFNIISPAHFNDGKALKGRKAYMNRFADLGVRVNYNLAGILTGGDKDLPYSDRLEMLRKEIELFRNHPALLSWYLAEEPETNGITPDILLQAYKLIKELDPYHPVSILLSSPRHANFYTDVTDIVMVAPTPIPQGVIREVIDYTRIPAEVFRMQKPVWVVPQVYGGNQWWLREPSPQEARAMTYLALITGATGIQYHNTGSCSSPKSTALWDECGAMALEIAELTPDILSPHPAPELISDNPWIHAKSWNRMGLLTIIVVNDRNEPGSFKLKMKDIDLTIPADVMFENRMITVTDGLVEDIIDGYGTRVYRFDARHKPDWVKELQPGNLSIDPGFEDITNPGVPSACFVIEGADPGNTFFIDSRKHFNGEHSLRMNNPSTEPGDRLLFYGLDLQGKKSYTVSIMAKTGQSSNIPPGKKEKVVRFTLGLGIANEVFTCSDSWEKYELNGIRVYPEGSPGERISPRLEMAGKGTAWFDNLLVYPDMEITEHKGTEGTAIIELKCIHADSKIFYTTDGSEPAQTSLPYMVPVEADQNTIVKAAAYRDNLLVGYIER